MKDINIKYYPADDLVMAEYNPRQLTKDQYTQLKYSIMRFGLVDPLIVNKNKERKNILVGGHQRLRIAKEMGVESIPCVEVDLTLDQEKELNIRLNKNVGEWDFDARLITLMWGSLQSGVLVTMTYNSMKMNLNRD